jgi:hypothetical protein
MTESEFSLSEIYTAANGSPIIKVVSDTKTVIARFNRASSGHISVAPESPGLTPGIHDIVMHSNTDIVVALHNLVIVFAVAPKLIGLTGVQIAAAEISGVKRRNIVGASVAVHTKNC